MYCIKCGASIKNGTHFCGKCGTKIEASNLKDSTFNSQINSTNNGPYSTKNKSSSIAIALILLIIVVMPILFVLYNKIISSEEEFDAFSACKHSTELLMDNYLDIHDRFMEIQHDSFGTDSYVVTPSDMQSYHINYICTQCYYNDMDSDDKEAFNYWFEDKYGFNYDKLIEDCIEDGADQDRDDWDRYLRVKKKK